LRFTPTAPPEKLFEPLLSCCGGPHNGDDDDEDGCGGGSGCFGPISSSSSEPLPGAPSPLSVKQFESVSQSSRFSISSSSRHLVTILMKLKVWNPDSLNTNYTHALATRHDVNVFVS
jgi:hypothetical protein